MKRFYQFSLLMLALLLPALALAHDFEVDGIYYNINGNEATVTYEGTDDYGHNTYTGNVTIPAKVTYNGITFSVTCIGDSAFAGCNALASIVIPNSVTSIGDYAFDCCSSLTSIEIPNSITSIGTSAFFYCFSLTSIEIPNSVTSIGSGAFNACPVTSITVACDNPSYDSRDTCNAIIETATNILIAGCRNTVIPNSVTSIGDYAFGYCDLTSIEIPNSVTSIGTSAFSGCGLTSIEIPNSVTSIGTSAFSGCGLTSVTLPNSVTSIGDYAFDCCSSLTSIEIPNSVTSIGNHAFYSCKSLTSIDFNSSSS